MALQRKRRYFLLLRFGRCSKRYASSGPSDPLYAISASISEHGSTYRAIDSEPTSAAASAGDPAHALAPASLASFCSFFRLRE